MGVACCGGSSNIDDLVIELGPKKPAPRPAKPEETQGSEAVFEPSEFEIQSALYDTVIDDQGAEIIKICDVYKSSE